MSSPVYNGCGIARASEDLDVDVVQRPSSQSDESKHRLGACGFSDAKGFSVLDRFTTSAIWKL